MAGRSLDDLPPELLLEVCEYIDAAHKPSLKALSRTNKALLNPCSSLLFRTIRFHASSPEKCKQDVKEWSNMLSRRNCLEDVRTVEIHGFMASDEDQTEFKECEYCRGDFGPSSMEFGLHDHGSTMNLDAEDEAFHPISTFLTTKLPHATDVIWRCHNVVAQSLLTALCDVRASLRLHVDGLKLLHLDSNSIGVRELQILQSPSLHSLVIHYVASEMNGNWTDDKPKQVISKLIAGLTPNLQHLRTLGCNNKVYNHGHQSPTLSLGLVEQRMGALRPANLKSLRLYPTRPVIDGEDLPIWHSLINPSVLQCLELGSIPATFLVQWIRDHARFEHLQELKFPLDSPEHPEVDTPIRGENIRSWLVNSMPPLQKLHLSGPLFAEYVPVLTSALEYHGPTLRKFVYDPPVHVSRDDLYSGQTFEMEFERILTMAKMCPVLEELSLPLRRGYFRQSHDLQLYRALALFPRLRALSLQIDGACWGLDDVAQDSGEDKTREDREVWSDGTSVTRGRVRRTLINAALDESLALQIWNVISSTKKVHGAVALQSLEVTSKGNAVMGIRLRQDREIRRRFLDLFALFKELERSYHVSRTLRDDACEEVVVEEVGKEKRERERWDVCHPNGSVMGLFRSIWPETSEGSDWREDWYSFPLMSADD